jgi:hypothetical protein
MTAIANSTATLAAGQSSSWFTPAQSVFFADVDTDGSVMLETRRGSSDAAPKRVAFGVRDGARVITGPACVQVASCTGRDFRFVCVTGSAVAVAADE